MEQRLPQPDRERLSALAALVLITYGLLRIISLPTIVAEFSLFGILFRPQINTRVIMLSLSAILTSTGADWVLRSHPIASTKRFTPDHLVIPGLAAFGVGAIVARIPEGTGLWIGLALAAMLLVALVSAEFVVFDTDDPRRGIAALGLRLLAYLLLLGTLFAIHATNMRAAYAVPLVFASCSIVAWRLLQLGQTAKANWGYGAMVGGMAAQLAWALHYWPAATLQKSLVLGLSVYLGVELVLASIQQHINISRAVELGIVGLACLSAILLVR